MVEYVVSWVIMSYCSKECCIVLNNIVLQLRMFLCLITGLRLRVLYCDFKCCIAVELRMLY